MCKVGTLHICSGTVQGSFSYHYHVTITTNILP